MNSKVTQSMRHSRKKKLPAFVVVAMSTSSAQKRQQRFNHQVDNCTFLNNIHKKARNIGGISCMHNMHNCLREKRMSHYSVQIITKNKYKACPLACKGPELSKYNSQTGTHRHTPSSLCFFHKLFFILYFCLYAVLRSLKKFLYLFPKQKREVQCCNKCPIVLPPLQIIICSGFLDTLL